MKRKRSTDNSSVFFISKWVILIAIIVVTSLSFILGYYVGKQTRPSAEKQSSLNPFEQITETGDQEVSKQNQGLEQDTLLNEKSNQINKALNTKNAEKSTRNIEPQKPDKPKNTLAYRAPIKKRKYTVQAGAFRSVHDANALKEKLAKKGYTAYIIQAETKKHEILYKVMIGEFTTRKEADLLSVKIKKSEGLKTFVTIKTKENVLR